MASNTAAEAVGHLSFVKDKPILNSTKPFRVRLMTPIPGVYEEEIVWAHYYTADHALTFVVLKLKDVEVVGKDGTAESVKSVISTLPVSFAPGQWRDVREEFDTVPPGRLTH